MQKYDPEKTPNPSDWLAQDEQIRIDLAFAYHKAAKLKAPNPQAHAVIHTIIENQIAEGIEAVVRALERLQRQGLTRHDAVHAIGSVLTEQLFDQSKQQADDDAAMFNARYNAAVERLCAKQWLKGYDQK